MKVTIVYKDGFSRESYKTFNNVTSVDYDRAMNAFVFTDDKFANGFNVRDVEIDKVIINE